MKITKVHWVSIGIAVLLVGMSFLFMGTRFFFIILGAGVIVGVLPFVFSIIKESKISSEKEEMFLEFARNLVESVKTGTPISKSIVNVKSKDYKSLNSHVHKLANQITIGIPLNTALRTFSREVNNKSVSRALTLIGEAERAGGNIGEILEAVAGAVTTSDKLRKERKAAISTLVAQGYIIFAIFLIIILVMQFRILPLVAGIATGDTGSQLGGFLGGVGGGGTPVSAAELSSAFLYLLLIQGFFSGLTIGKLSEGNVKAGIKHSFSLMFFSFLVSTLANLVFGA